MIRIALISLLCLNFFGFNPVLWAQETTPPAEAIVDQPEEVASEPVDPPAELRLFEFELAGFALSGMSEYEPVVRETSDGTVYAVTYQRRGADGGAMGTDGRMAFMRLTRTIDPLSETGSVEKLLDTTIREAYATIDHAYGVRRDRKFSDRTLEILGEPRKGRRIDVGVHADGSQTYVECYAFEDENGIGVGVAMKLREPVGNDIPLDLILADELLADLKILNLEPDAQYFHSFAGYPLRLPVRSTILNQRRVNQRVAEANIAYEFGTVRVQVLNVPNEFSPHRMAREQVVGYARTLVQQDQQGQLELEWSAPSVIPAGIDGNGIAEGMVFGLTTNGIAFYNSMYAVVDQGVVVAASFTGNQGTESKIAGYAADFFARPIGSASRVVLPAYIDGFSIALPSQYSVWSNPEAKDFREVLIDVSLPGEWAEKFESPLTSRGGYTLMQMFPLEQQATLDSAHTELCERMLSLLGGSGDRERPILEEPSTAAVTLGDGRVVDSLTRVFVPDISAETMQEHGVSNPHAVKVTSYMVPVEAGRSTLVVSTVASDGTHADSDLLTRLVLDRIGAMEEPDRVAMPFGSVIVPPAESIAQAQMPPDDDGSIRALRLIMGADEMLIKSHGLDDADDDTRTLRVITEDSMRAEWDRATVEHEQNPFPADSEGLVEVKIAGYPGRMYEAYFEPAASETDGEQPESLYLRIVGFAHAGGYTTVLLKQSGERNPERCERMLGLLQGVGGDVVDD